MRPRHTITSPTHFIVQDYSPGLLIDFQHPGESTDLESIREHTHLEAWRGLALEQLLEKADALCLHLGLSEEAGDLLHSLRQFTGQHDPARALHQATLQLGVHPPEHPLDQLKELLRCTGSLRRAHHHPVRLYCHDPEAPTLLEAEHTHYGYVLDGHALTLEHQGRTYPLFPHTWFCAPGEARIHGPGRVEVISRLQQQGLFTLGGAIEPWGRLQYIDGCTDTVLSPPVKLGSACYNALYFPPHTRQTQHTHPSLRAGLVIAGRGVCKTPYGEHALEPGKIFFLPPETWHAFHTGDGPQRGRAALTVLAFHPDSDFGPTDEDHPMLNRTYFHFLHRLRSAQRLRDGC